ncbi:MAG: phytoene/squalene synthase family protein, partial [Rhodothermales bacterium]|nr:phytoene/squalene synthase family protein [Rhodothermales bacterium]
YFYCRTIDNIADTASNGQARDAALRELATARRALDDTLAGRPPAAGLIWRRLAELHERYTLHTPPLYELIDGAEWDLRGIHIETEDDLIRYANLVAGSIGSMMLPFLIDERDDLPRLEAPARDLGIAMQITNILRDVGEDARALGRVYIPSATLARFGCRGADLASTTLPEGYPELIEYVMEMAEEYFVSGRSGIAALNRSVRPGIEAAARIYREILNEIRRRDYDNLNERAYTSRAKKVQLLLFDTYERRKRRLQGRSPARLTA